MKEIQKTLSNIEKQKKKNIVFLSIKPSKCFNHFYFVSFNKIFPIRSHL